MKNYGILHKQHHWFSSYLENRSQVVSCHNQISEKSYITLGVPQGSVLGPILFTLFSNDLPNHTHLGSCNMFADDTLIYTTGKSSAEVQNKLQLCINEAADWYLDNNLLLNATKSNSLLLNNSTRQSKTPNPLDIFIGTTKIDHVSQADYLGLRIDNNLSWESHIGRLCKRLGSKIAELKHLRKTANNDILLHFYNVYIQPIIDYGITLWSNVPNTLLYKVQRMQNICARIISKKL